MLLKSFLPPILTSLSIPRFAPIVRNSSKTMSTTNQDHLIAVLQLNCKGSKDENWNVASKLVSRAASMGCSMAFLPECFDMVCESRKETLEKLEPIDGPLVTKYRELAAEKKIWLSLGGLHESNPSSDDGKAFNAHIVINDKGDIVSVYHKVHLFNLEIPNVVRLIESEFSIAGQKLQPPCQTPVGKVGLGICYDVRFPEMSIALAKSGADILTFPSAFTVPTGMDHWSTLLRARAIENQCYVVAAAQTGLHNPKRSSYGHAMVIDPWGAIVAQCSEGPGLSLALIQPSVLVAARSKLPVWTDRRPDIYGEIISPSTTESIDDREVFNFGQFLVQHFQVFLKTRYSFAFVNHRPVLPGHVLLSPLRREAKRLSDLKSCELTDLIHCIKLVQEAVEKEFGAKSSTINIQDGPEAGQSVDHLHVHILPRKSTDFGGNIDMIYKELSTHDKGDNVKKYPLQTDDQMKQSAINLRKYFN